MWITAPPDYLMNAALASEYKSLLIFQASLKNLGLKEIHWNQYKSVVSSFVLFWYCDKCLISVKSYQSFMKWQGNNWLKCIFKATKGNAQHSLSQKLHIAFIAFVRRGACQKTWCVSLLITLDPPLPNNTQKCRHITGTCNCILG